MAAVPHRHRLGRRTFLAQVGAGITAVGCGAELDCGCRPDPLGPVQLACDKPRPELPGRYRAVASAFCAGVEHGDVVGAAMAVGEGGTIRFSATAGATCHGEPDPVTPDTAFRIGSITKVLTGALAVSLHRQGVVDLDRPIVEVLPELALKPAGLARRITLRHLLTHTAGLPDALPQAGAEPDFVRATMLSPPGEQWVYSNVGYYLVGMVLERGAGQPYAALLQEHVLDPLGLSSMAIATDGAPKPHWACEHIEADGTPVPYRTDASFARFAHGAQWAAPAGAAVSTAADLVGLADATVADGGPAPELTALWRDPVATGEANVGGGLGVFVRPLPRGGPLVYHRGNTGTSSAELYWLPRRGLSIAIVSNTRRPLRSALVAAMDKLGDVDAASLWGP